MSAPDPSDNSPPHDPYFQPQPQQQQGTSQSTEESNPPPQQLRVQVQEQQQPLLAPAPVSGTAAAVPASLPLAFDHYAPKYRCCCGSMHVKIGVIVIGILSVFFLGFSIWSAVYWIGKHGYIGYIDLSTWIIYIPVLICLFVGVFTRNHYLLLPYVIYGIIVAILDVILTITFVVLISVAANEVKDEVDKHSGVNMPKEEYEAGLGVVITLVILGMILQVTVMAWFTWVVFKCYRYFRDIKNYCGNAFIGPAP